MIINTELPKDLDTLPLLKQEKILGDILTNIRKAEDIIREKLAHVRGQIH